MLRLELLVPYLFLVSTDGRSLHKIPSLGFSTVEAVSISWTVSLATLHRRHTRAAFLNSCRPPLVSPMSFRTRTRTSNAGPSCQGLRTGGHVAGVWSGTTGLFLMVWSHLRRLRGFANRMLLEDIELLIFPWDRCYRLSCCLECLHGSHLLNAECSTSQLESGGRRKMHNTKSKKVTTQRKKAAGCHAKQEITDKRMLLHHNNMSQV